MNQSEKRDAISPESLLWIPAFLFALHPMKGMVCPFKWRAPFRANQLAVGHPSSIPHTPCRSWLHHWLPLCFRWILL